MSYYEEIPKVFLPQDELNSENDVLYRTSDANEQPMSRPQVTEIRGQQLENSEMMKLEDDPRFGGWEN